MIVISICAEDIKPLMKKSEKNGKHYINLVVDERREKDQQGNTHSVYASQSKDERLAKTPKKFVGSGKEFKFSNETKPTNQSNVGIENDGVPF